MVSGCLLPFFGGVEPPPVVDDGAHFPLHRGGHHQSLGERDAFASHESHGKNNMELLWGFNWVQ
jgi:hypothetical protein